MQGGVDAAAGELSLWGSGPLLGSTHIERRGMTALPSHQPLRHLASALGRPVAVFLKDAGHGNGAHAYSFTTPASLKNNATHQISAKILNSSYILKGAPKPLTCAPSAARVSAGVPERTLTVTVLGNPVGETVGVEVRGAEGQFLHMQLSDLNGRMLAEQVVAEAGAVEIQHLPIGRQPTGLLLLRVVSGQQAVTVKVLKP